MNEEVDKDLKQKAIVILRILAGLEKKQKELQDELKKLIGQ